MRNLLCFCLGVIAGLFLTAYFELRVTKTWNEKNQRIEKLDQELYETKLEVRKLWKEKNQAYAIVAELKRRISEN